jgi:hypothetical protein
MPPPMTSRSVAGRPVKTAIVVLLYVGTVALFVESIIPFHRRNTGFTSLIAFGDTFQRDALPALAAVPHVTQRNSPGYDGQFYAQLALEPLFRNRDLDRALDNPPYRAQRILFSWTAYVFGLGRPAWIIQAYAVQNIVVWGLLAVLLLRWLPPTSPRHFAAWFACMFSAGLMDSVRMALLEGPSMLVLLLAVLATEMKRPWLSASLLALGGLARETNLTGAPILVGRFPSSIREVGRLVGMLLLTIAPLLIWSLYVRSVYGSAHYAGTSNLDLPFVGLVADWKSAVAGVATLGWSSLHRFQLMMLVSVTVQALFVVTQWDCRNAWWRLGAAYAVLMTVLGGAVWAGYPGAAVRILLPMTFAFNILLVRNRWFWPLVLLGNISVLYGIQKIEVPWISRLI